MSPTRPDESKAPNRMSQFRMIGLLSGSPTCNRRRKSIH